MKLGLGSLLSFAQRHPKATKVALKGAYIVAEGALESRSKSRGGNPSSYQRNRRISNFCKSVDKVVDSEPSD